MRNLPLVLLLSACAPAPSPPGTYDGLSTLVLRDVQGLFGGRDLWIRADGTTIIRTVRPPKPGESGMQEVRYAGKPAIDDLKLLLARHDPFTMKIPERFGVPDEARPTLIVRLASGKTVTVAKWANQKHEDFDALYAWLMAQEEAAVTSAPTFRGACVHAWKPDGFQD